MTFQLDQSPGFYGFVFSYDGTCVAHGADDSFVGLSLKQVFERSHIEEGGAAALKGELTLTLTLTSTLTLTLTRTRTRTRTRTLSRRGAAPALRGRGRGGRRLGEPHRTQA